MKELWLLDEAALDDPNQIGSLRKTLRCVQTWPARTLLEFMRRYRRVSPLFLAECLREAKDAHLEFAALLADGKGGKNAAA